MMTGGFTPQDKIIGVSNKFGNDGIKRQQGSSVVLYDTLPVVAGVNEYRFFEGSSQRNFPLSNTGADGNKLGVGYSMIVERAYFSFVIFNEDSQTWLNVQTPAIWDTFQIGEFSFEIANSQVLKQYSGLDFNPQFNKSAVQNNQWVLEWDTQLNIQPLLEFVAIYRVQNGIGVPEIKNLSVRLTIEGTGAIIAPRTTF